ncbi:MAG: hypothetical protein V8Q40_11995 [Anaerosacchariphilus sp.]
MVKRDYYQNDRTDKVEYITDIIKEKTDLKKAGEDYLKQIYLLTKCKTAILSKTSATPDILFLSKYEKVYIWNLGLYGIDD